MTDGSAPAGASTSTWVDNVLVETAIVDGGDGARTESSLSAIRIEDGVFTEIRLGESAPRDQHPGEDIAVVDATGLLLMPSLRDTHIHLDKTFYGGPWRAPIPGRHWLAEEERLLPEMSAAIPIRSNAILDLLVANGTTEVVAHCNVDHIVGVRNVERLLAVTSQREDVDSRVVAYPQHGLRGGAITPLLVQALEAGATVVGGIDPGLLERNIEQTLETVFGLAVDYDVDVDLHLHDAGSLGLFEIDRVIDHTIDVGWQGRVSLSNASALASAGGRDLRARAERLASARVSVGATMSVGGPVIPIPTLSAAGVEVSLGSDSITDILTPFGQGDIGEQVWMLAQRFGWSDELHLAQSLIFGAGEPARWTDDGHRDWPGVGDQASFLLVPASCTAEAVARRIGPQRVFHRGRPTYSAPSGVTRGR